MPSMHEDLESMTTKKKQDDDEEYCLDVPVTEIATNSSSNEEEPITTTTSSTPSSSSLSSPYATSPMLYSVIFILLPVFSERFAFNGVVFTFPGFSDIQTGSYISMTQGIGYMSPFFTAFVADALLGDYKTILIFTILFCIPGLFLIAVVSIPDSLNTQDFPTKALHVGTHILFPLGFGAAKTLYGVYAAKQYNPKTQAEKTKQFFVTFTAVEFIGSFLGAVVCIIMSSIGHFIASGFTCAAVLVIGLLFFIFGTKRYVNGELKRKRYMLMLLTIVDAISCCKRTKPNEKNNNHMSYDMDQLLRDTSQDIDCDPDESNDQVSNVVLLHCKFMQNSGLFNGPMVVSTSYLFIGFWAVLIKKYITPLLGRRNITLTISNKFVLGSLFLTLGLAVDAIIASQMIRMYDESGGAISIFYGLFATFFIGGMAFSLAATNELAFVVASAELKMLGTAVMLFLTQGIPNILGAQLFRRCRDWFDVNGVQASTLEEYAHSDSLNFMYVLMGFTLYDVILFSLPPVWRWMDNFEETSKANNLRADTECNTATYSTSNVLSTISENNVWKVAIMIFLSVE
ncbi:hypothetical protein FRACYDRAFT_257326 [Fragilariopsis cylindrus CCMP1102]|uniref:MFS general substrate transporter n=1 Tax=Fragilariopsis cylindrus CCMP1102 TaxID=635003 RepID=A0A1E7EJB2_9STRA|nr:hypothetical protein FRACYDRAFT_257326 [Fragilariopsis cylindrus CCMP1102]|eukprot:OEU05942.1 hypothetical protein FRACYDRAFT_257326 [Fragilariopsis cylindrus CCMP1102]